MDYTADELECISLSRKDEGVDLDVFVRNLTAQGIIAVTKKSQRYPKQLLNLENPPVVLYCRGNLELLKRPAVAIVGTRDCTRYGQDVASRFAKEFADRGLVVISGLADGIDTASHLGAMPCTIGVLGNGLNVYYPKANAKLQKDMFEKALVISEFLPNAQPTRFNFPHRNRIVAALASALLIVEADIKSGTMITRDWALDLGIDVYCVPGPITSTASRGTNQMIKEGGMVATCADDVLASFGTFEKSKETIDAYIQLSFDEKSVLDLLKKGEPL